MPRFFPWRNRGSITIMDAIDVSEQSIVSISLSNLIDDNESVQPSRRAIITELTTSSALEGGDVENFDKDERTCELIRKALMANDFIKNLLDEDRTRAVINAMELKEFKKDSYILREGESGSHLYVSEKGTFFVIKGNRKVKEFGAGEAFGELAVLYKAKRFASIIAASDAKIWLIERRVFQKIMVRNVVNELEDNIKFLSSVPALALLNRENFVNICGFLQREFYPSGVAIVRQGEVGDRFYIIRGGTVKVTKRPADGGPDQFIKELTKGDYFGEQALTKSDTRLATVTATGTGVECLLLERGPFNKYLGNIDDIVLKQYETPRSSNPRKKEQVHQVPEIYARIQFSDLELIGTLGVGAFGRVELVQNSKDKRNTFALKCLKKFEIVQQEQQHHVFNEKNIMFKCDSRFICRLFNTYKDKKYVYFLMEPILGGDVFTILQKKKFFDEKTSRFMAACVVEAFDYLHKFNIIYRDLKPENLMIDSKGYVKLVDFGYAKYLYNDFKTYTFAGTPEYVAPEIVLGNGHDRAVDLWTLGILIHEFLVGKPPFRGPNQISTYNLIIRGMDLLDLDARIPKHAQILIKKLCRSMPCERIGYLRRGIKDIKMHRWFNDFDWTKLKNGQLKAPLVLPISSNKDLTNFGKQQKDVHPPDENSGWDIDF